MAEGSQTLTPDTQFFRDVFNASPIGIVVENLEGQPLFVNPAFCSMIGFSEEESRGKHCVQFSPPEDAEKDWGLFQQLRAGSIDHYQLEKRYSTGRLVGVGVLEYLFIKQSSISTGNLKEPQRRQYAPAKNGCDWLSRLLASEVLIGMSRQA
jgi:PAS domain S-box-containing protein